MISRADSRAGFLRPLRELPPRDRARVRALFTDVDGTLTTGGKLLPSTYRALWRWKEAGKILVLVSGRAAGWAEGWARMWPVDAVIAENGGVAFLNGPDGLRRTLALPAARLARARARMARAAREVERAVPGAKLSADSRYTEVDLAVDYNEGVKLGPEVADRIEALLRRRGFSAVRSSVHVNFWPGRFDKLVASRALARRLGLDLQREVVYSGDSLNDQPMFGALPLSVGVGNLREVLDRLEVAPRYLTRAREGRGFEELVRTLLAGRG